MLLKKQENVNINCMQILAPAGNKDSLKQAIQNGADCVYLGVNEFNARMNAENFSLENFSETVAFCHLFGVKVFLTLNILIKPNEFDNAVKTAISAYEQGVDGIICADFGLAKILAQNLVGCDVVFSTQANIQNTQGCVAAKELGINSVVLSREIDKTTVKNIYETIPDMNLEYFGHGALCVCVSGQCQLSSVAGPYSGNRGQCKQPCRQKYVSYDKNGKVLKEGYLLSAKDLCLIKKLDELKELGINRLKIEGRNRRKEYVGQATKLYRLAVDGKKVGKSEINQLKKVFNRGDFTQGYFYEKNAGNLIYPYVQGHKGLSCGKIVSINKDICKARCEFELKEGDAFKILRNNSEVGNAIYFSSNKDGSFNLKFKGEVRQGDELSITGQTSQLNDFSRFDKSVDVRLVFEAKIGNKMQLSASAKNIEVQCKSDFVCPEAEKSSTSEQEISTQLSKTGDFQFTITNIVIKKDNVFIPKSQLNELRRQTLLKLAKKLTEQNRVSIDDFKLPKIQSKNFSGKSAVVFCSEKQICNELKSVDILIYKPFDFSKQNVEKVSKLLNKEFYLDLPNFATDADVQIIDNLLDVKNMVGICANSLYAVELAKKHGKKLFLGKGINIFNDFSAQMFDEFSNETSFSYSNELTFDEIKQFKDKSGFVPLFGYNCCMTLAHCPIQVNYNCTCENCKYNGDIFYRDTLNNTFNIKRKRISKCYFELYNGVATNNLGKAVDYNIIVDICDIDDLSAKSILNYLADRQEKNIPALKFKSTSGHFNKCVK